MLSSSGSWATRARRCCLVIAGDKLEGKTNGRRVKRKLNDRANTPNSNPSGYRRVNNDRYDFVEGNVL
uniref:Uncharacterized protein n=1 Tax=Rhinopithecus bieti TaxID=61621 RepID=A0A2K6KF16_RHIBE